MARKKSQPRSPIESLTHSLRSRYKTFKASKPRIHRRGSETARQIEQEQAAKPLTFWVVMFRLLPMWVLIIFVLILEPTLPFRAIGAAFQEVVGLFRPGGSSGSPPAEPVFIVEGATIAPTPATLPLPGWSLEIATVFTAQVQHWGTDIGNWSLAYRIQPNLIATLMQIESCGNPNAVSASGAQGLFQVMPLHFVEGDNPLDPDTNAGRALLYFGELLASANGDPGLAFAAYNGGPALITTSPSQWPRETQDFQFWASGIYEEAERGLAESPTLADWLNAGGADLCIAAHQALGLP